MKVKNLGHSSALLQAAQEVMFQFSVMVSSKPGRDGRFPFLTKNYPCAVVTLCVPNGLIFNFPFQNHFRCGQSTVFSA